jgi:hypothetical protein
MFSMAATRGALKPYLNVIDDTLVAELAPCTIPRCGEGIGSDVQEGAIARIRDVNRRNGNYQRSALQTKCRLEDISIQRVWSRR